MAEALAFCKRHLHGLYQSQGWGCQVCHAVWLRVWGVIKHVCHRSEPRTADRNPLQVWLMSLVACWWLRPNIGSVSVCIHLCEPSPLVTAGHLDGPHGLNPMLPSLKSFAILHCVFGWVVAVSSWVSGCLELLADEDGGTAILWSVRTNWQWHSVTPQKAWISYIGWVK
jgi:hypothetical protein